MMNNLSMQKLPKRIAGLHELAYNLWWSWHYEARELFKSLDRPLWKMTSHNPVKLLQQIPPYRLVAAAEDAAFLKEYDAVMASFRTGMLPAPTWFHSKYAHLDASLVAYFSFEFAFHNSLPLYAGGLGVLAGDYCKEASDLGIPMVAVGFMYPQGYFSQHISDDGWQEELYRQLNFNESPIIPLLTIQKQPVKVNVELDSRTVALTVWLVNIGRVKVYLLDTNLEENSPADRQLTARLYSGDRELRLQQEIILGVGGVRMLRALGVAPSIWHANEGHTTFMMLERCRELVAQGIDFPRAAEQVRNTSIFTTHTPVPAGNDAFHHSLMEKCFHNYWDKLTLNRESFLKLGTQDSDNTSFNMTVLGLRMAQQRNGVSQLHGAVCRSMWQCIWPEVAEKDIPIAAVTNGIHVPSWIAPQIARLYEKYLGDDWLARHDDPALWENIDNIPDEEIWAAHLWLKNKLISTVQARARGHWSENGGSPSSVLAMGALLDAEVLTIGFSRRFTDYKRASLILRDQNRLKRLVKDGLRPIQIVFAGKAHPNDHHGKQLIQEAYNIARNPEFGGRIAFVEDYDMHLARYLVPGVDVWLNTPRPTQEASGTSGMKAAVNGVPHLSVLDGWWYEAYNGTNGWAIHNDGNMNAAEQDTADANELYHILEDKVIPLYYDHDRGGVPHGWIKMVKQTIRSNIALFSARRMLKEYTEQLYLPAAQAGAMITQLQAQIDESVRAQKQKSATLLKS
ncbi:MAG: alpha-glucan family phosphorylase [Dehalococcoidales bacterium]|nr:alpha-glucan family phosphorylase [Dehalococcoidales bacterium]